MYLVKMQKEKRFIPRQVKFLHPNAGYVLLEILVVCAMLTTLSVASLYYSSKWQESTRKLSVRLAAQAFVADLRRLQEDSMYGDSNSITMKIASTKDAYYYYEQTKLIKSVNLAREGFKDVYFSSSLASLSFSGIGAPSAANNYSYILRHKQLSNFSCIVKIEAVTGRMSVNEGK